jgi:prepilin-type N-terminal cleavage/methylation domain-containing protein
MNSAAKHNGFSLTEVLMAVGILTVGMLLIATMFPVGIYLTAVASERTMAAIVADEAFAKIQFYSIVGASNDSNNCYDWGDEMYDANEIAESEFAYPSVDPCSNSSQYYWSALYRKTPGNAADKQYQITVFVARKTNPGLTYEDNGGSGSSSSRPVPIMIPAPGLKDLPELTISAGNENLVNPPTTIIDNETGRLYRIVKRGDGGNTIVTLDRPLEENIATIWLIPPPQSGGKNADVEVYQRIIKF